MEERKLREIQVGTEDIFEGVILNVKRDQVQLPNGHQSVREVIRHVGAVCVVPVTADGKVVVERQYRYPVGAPVLEIPAGKIDLEALCRAMGFSRVRVVDPYDLAATDAAPGLLRRENHHVPRSGPAHGPAASGRG